VAHGKLTLNDAIERMARRSDVERLMRKHDLTRAIATQIVLGHANLEAYLQRRRLAAHRENYRTRSCLDDAVAAGSTLTLLLHGQRRVEAKVKSIDPYDAVLAIEGGGEEQVRKLQIKATWRPDDYKRIKKVLRKDKALSEAPRGPIERPQDRYSCSDKRLFRYLDTQTEVDVTLLEGEVFSGTVQWFGRYEFGLEIKGGVVVTIFRHALSAITESKG
jgi:sRNA-binding regulator protein Hfq